MLCSFADQNHWSDQTIWRRIALLRISKCLCRKRRMPTISHLQNNCFVYNYWTKSPTAATAPKASPGEHIKAASHSTVPASVKLEPNPQFNACDFSNSCWLKINKKVFPKPWLPGQEYSAPPVVESPLICWNFREFSLEQKHKFLQHYL